VTNLQIAVSDDLLVILYILFINLHLTQDNPYYVSIQLHINCEMFFFRIVDRLPQIYPDRLRCQPADDEFESEKHAIYRYFISL